MSALALIGLTTSLAAPPPITPRDAIKTTRFMVSGAPDGGEIAISPDGQLYVVRTVTGDVARNGIVVKILSGSLEAGSESAAPQVIGTLFSSGRGVTSNSGPEADGSGYASPIRWIGNRTIAFLFSDSRETRQVVTVDIPSGTTQFITGHPTQIRAFDITSDGTVVYLARDRGASEPKPVAAGEGYVVPEGSDATSIAQGFFDGSNIFSRAWDSEWFVQRRGEQPRVIKVGGNAVDGGIPNMRLVKLSHSGKQAVLVGPVAAIPARWNVFAADAGEGQSFASRLAAARASPNGLGRRELQQLYLLDIASGGSRPLLDAPLGLHEVSASWSLDDRFILLSPAPVPNSCNAPGGALVAAMAIVDAFKGTCTVIHSDGRQVERFRWVSNDAFDLRMRNDAKSVQRTFRWRQNEWRSEIEPARVERNHTQVRVEVRQAINTPPRLYAVDRHRRSKMILDPNPGLASRYSMGPTERLTGTLSSGERWSALLFLPVEYRAGLAYPLVIQSQYHVPVENKFTLYGWARDDGLGPTTIAPYAAQSLAGRQIAVLQLNVDGAEIGSPSEVDSYQRAFEEVSRLLIERGIADAGRIGLIGFSRNGYFVSYTLTHSAFPFAAAILADNYDPSYLQTTLADSYALAQLAIGTSPFGEGLSTWLSRAPGFNVEKIRAPLRLVGQSTSTREYVLWGWEIFGRLRELGRPVEMYLMPECDLHPSHNPQNPKQILAVQDGTVDWFDFWLNGRASTDTEKAAQYSRWHALRIQSRSRSGPGVSAAK
jgi:dipeptidyl aminopeptidase/acylaminoacyl peptidase